MQIIRCKLKNVFRTCIKQNSLIKHSLKGMIGFFNFLILIFLGRSFYSLSLVSICRIAKNTASNRQRLYGKTLED